MTRFDKLARAAIIAGVVTFASRPALAYVDEVQPAPGFQQYKPVYFLFGETDSKLALSLKVRVFPLAGLYAAYTQLMFWRLWEESLPFHDVNYNPELFYRFQFGDETNWYADLGLVEHESNGLDRDTSRSWNRSYVRYSMTNSVSDTSRARIHWNVKVWVPYSIDKETNGDLLRYRGFYEGQISLVDAFGFWLDRSDITLRFYGGGASHVNPLKGGQELTVRFAPRLMSASVAQIVIQFFHGYGENLLDYDTNKTVFRAGLGF